MTLARIQNPRRKLEGQISYVRTHLPIAPIFFRILPMNDVRAILFDWGGTLVRISRQQPTRTKSVHACIEYLRGLGVKLSSMATGNLMTRFINAVAERRDPNDMAEFDSRSAIDQWRVANNVQFPDTFDWDACIDATWRPWRGCLDPIGDLPATLSQLRDRGYALGLLSNCATPAHVARDELERLGILSLLDMTLFSSELGLRKPHPEIYRMAIERMQPTIPGIEANRMLYVGDTPIADVVGPAQCGMRTALVRSGNFSNDKTELTTEPDIIIDCVHDLPAHLPEAPLATNESIRPSTGAA